MRSGRALILLAACLWLGAGSWPLGLAWAEEPAVPSLVLDDRDCYRLGGHLEILEDQEKKFTLPDVVSPSWSGKFSPASGLIPNLGVISSAVWVKFRVANPSKVPADLLLSYNYPVTDRVSFFWPDRSEGYTRLDAGDSISRSDGVIPHRYFVFPLPVPPQKELTGYLRLESSASMTVHLELWRREAFYYQDHWRQLAFGVLFGATALFVVYFTSVAVILRNPACLWFSLYVAFLGLLLATRKGYLHELLQPVGFEYSNILGLVIIGLLYFTGAKLLRIFLNIRRYSRRIDIILIVLQWMGLLFVPLSLLRNPLIVLYSLFLFGLGPVFSTSVSVVYWAKGVPNAKYFALGWLVAHLTSVLDYLRISGFIAYQPFMDYLLPVSLALTLAFFALAIIDQTYTYQFFARQDPLTGLANRRYFAQQLEGEWNRSLRHDRPLSVLMVDVDHFKEYNDHYGHVAGDDCLMRIAEVLKNHTRRAGDLAARYGGEEFVVLLAESEAEEAGLLAERIRRAVEHLGLDHGRSNVKRVVTISLGVAVAVPCAESSSVVLLRQADEALYQAKNAGRNRVVRHAVCDLK
ncbi:MAG: diguanylate cyclase [Thermodesulfobacteriota bacterium]